jgi:hypothetical protein
MDLDATTSIVRGNYEGREDDISGVNDCTSSRNPSLWEPLDAKEIERLGRIRPRCFKSIWSEIGFVLSVCMAQILTVCFSHHHLSRYRFYSLFELLCLVILFSYQKNIIVL